MASRSSRLAIVAQLSERELDHAGKQLQLSTQQYEYEKQRLEELEGYFLEYQQVSREQSRAGITVVRLMNFNHFMNNLRTAIEQQTRTVEGAALKREKVRQAWIELQAKTKNLRQLVDDARHSEAFAVEKKLQKELDDNHTNLKAYKLSK